MSTRRSSQRYVVKGSEDDLVAQGLAVKKGSSPVSATQESTARLWMPTSSLKQVKRRLLVFFKQGPGIGTTSSEVIELLEQPQVKSDSPSSAGQEVYVEDKIAVAQTYGPPRKSSLSGVKELPEDQETSPLPPGKENLPPAKRVPSFLGRHFTPSTHSDAPSSRSSTFGTIQELQSPAHSKPLGRRHGLISPPTVPSRSLSLGVAQKPAVSLGPVRSRSMSITGPRELRRVLANNAEPLYIGTQKQAQYNLFFPPSRHIIRQPPPPCREAVPKTRVTPPPGPTKKRKAQSYGPLRQAGHHAAARPPQIWTPLIFPRSSSTTDQQFSHHVQSHQRTISSTPKPKEPPKLPLFTPSIFLRPATSKYLRSRQRRWDSHSHSHTHTLSISISSTLATRGRSLDADSPTLLLADLDPIALNGLKRLLDRSPTVSWTWGVDDGQRTRVPVQRHAMSVEGGGSEGLGIAFRRHPRREK
ncbi:MAG: hypothetical protein M1817_001126 [Caeruleum heppii]|nr:MAG: hypothetical protein M1817_001126 [Caeruleum heppii]